MRVRSIAVSMMVDRARACNATVVVTVAAIVIGVMIVVVAMALAAAVVMVVIVVVAVVVMVAGILTLFAAENIVVFGMVAYIFGSTSISFEKRPYSAHEHRCAYGDHNQTGSGGKPWCKLFRKKIPGCEQSYQAQCEDAHRMCRRYRKAEIEGMDGSSSRTDQISAHDRFSVSGGECMGRPPRGRGQECTRDHRQVECLAFDKRDQAFLRGQPERTSRRCAVVADDKVADQVYSGKADNPSRYPQGHSCGIGTVAGYPCGNERDYNKAGKTDAGNELVPDACVRHVDAAPKTQQQSSHARDRQNYGKRRLASRDKQNAEKQNDK
jgi:hypothetical protein